MDKNIIIGCWSLSLLVSGLLSWWTFPLYAFVCFATGCLGMAFYFGYTYRTTRAYAIATAIMLVPLFIHWYFF